MQSLSAPGDVTQEEAAYFELGEEHLYTVLHAVTAPVARVLLVGPFASQRPHSYIPWVRWARYLASRRIEVLRFDYRGVGESTGTFTKMTLADWMDDVLELSAWLATRLPQAPLLLHGLSLGALFAAKAFDRGVGDGLVLWSPPPNANAILRSTLLGWVNVLKLSQRPEERKPLSDYLTRLENEGALDVNGYRWPIHLWSESFGFALPASFASAESAAAAYKRPVRIESLGPNASPLIRGGMAGYEESADLEWLFSATYSWIYSTIARSQEVHS